MAEALNLKSIGEASKLKRFIIAQFLALTAVMLICTIMGQGRFIFRPSLWYFYIVLGIFYVFTFCALLSLKFGFRPSRLFSYLLFAFYLTAVTAVVAFTGGANSFFVLLYVIVVLASGILLSLKASFVVATMSAVLYSLISFMDSLGQRGVLYTVAFPGQQAGETLKPDMLLAFTTIGIFAFYLTAFLSGFLSSRLGTMSAFQKELINNFTSGVLSIDAAGKVKLFNTAAANILGVPPEQAIGRHCSEIMRAADSEHTPLEITLHTRREFASHEWTMLLPDGRTMPTGMTTSLIRDRSGKVKGAITSFTDLTAMKKMEEEMKQHDRLAALGELSASLAHEIRNPVASIRSAVEELKETTQLSGVSDQLVNITIREADQLNEVVTDFLHFARLTPKNLAPASLKELLDEVVQSLEREVGQNGITITKNYPGDLGSILADRSQIRSTFMNVCQNAVDSMRTGGGLTISAPPDSQFDTVREVRFTDEGEGMTPEQLGNIFKPFYTTKEKGTGMGLAIVSRIISAHKGTVHVESQKGVGTTVIIRLPRERQWKETS